MVVLGGCIPIAAQDATNTVEQEDGYNMQDMKWIAIISGILLLGGAWFVLAGRIGTDSDFTFLLHLLPISAHAVITYLPWMVEAPTDICTSGSPWWQHALYAGVVVLASPGLAGVFSKDRLEAADVGGDQNDSVRVPFIGKCLARQCPDVAYRLAMVYCYASTLVAAADTYFDNNTIHLGKACGYEYWGLGLAVYIVSLALQVFTMFIVFVKDDCKDDCKDSCIMGGALSLMCFAGINLDLVVKTYKDVPFEEAFKPASAAVSIVRLLTEIIPQSGISLNMASSRGLKGGALYSVWASVALSLLMGLKTCFGAAKFFCPCLQRAEENMRRVVPVIIGESGS